MALVHKTVSARRVRCGAVLVWLSLLFSQPWVAGGATPALPNPGVPWPATDALGRRLPLSQEVGPPAADRFVGIFYFLWHNEPGGKSPNWDGPYDIARILARDPHAMKNPDSPLWGPIGTYHYWGEPLYGYYRAPIRGCCGATRNCWPTPASTR